MCYCKFSHGRWDQEFGNVVDRLVIRTTAYDVVNDTLPYFPYMEIKLQTIQIHLGMGKSNPAIEIAILTQLSW